MDVQFPDLIQTADTWSGGHYNTVGSNSRLRGTAIEKRNGLRPKMARPPARQEKAGDRMVPRKWSLILSVYEIWSLLPVIPGKWSFLGPVSRRVSRSSVVPRRWSLMVLPLVVVLGVGPCVSEAQDTSIKLRQGTVQGVSGGSRTP